MISSMLQYIQKSPDCFHAVENLRQRLLSEGYTQLTAGEWTLTPGGKYFVTKNGSSLMAFRVPQDRPTGFVLTASHSDSPCFRLRDHADALQSPQFAEPGQNERNRFFKGNKSPYGHKRLCP